MVLHEFIIPISPKSALYGMKTGKVDTNAWNGSSKRLQHKQTSTTWQERTRQNIVAFTCDQVTSN